MNTLHIRSYLMLIPFPFLLLHFCPSLLVTTHTFHPRVHMSRIARHINRLSNTLDRYTDYTLNKTIVITAFSFFPLVPFLSTSPYLLCNNTHVSSTPSQQSGQTRTAAWSRAALWAGWVSPEVTLKCKQASWGRKAPTSYYHVDNSTKPGKVCTLRLSRGLVRGAFCASLPQAAGDIVCRETGETSETGSLNRWGGRAATVVCWLCSFRRSPDSGRQFDRSCRKHFAPVLHCISKAVVEVTWIFKSALMVLVID